jgi:hypothetical protein
MSLRRRDVEQWMSHRRLSEELKRYAIPIILFTFLLACYLVFPLSSEYFRAYDLD